MDICTLDLKLAPSDLSTAWRVKHIFSSYIMSFFFLPRSLLPTPFCLNSNNFLSTGNNYLDARRYVFILIKKYYPIALSTIACVHVHICCLITFYTFVFRPFSCLCCCCCCYVWLKKKSINSWLITATVFFITKKSSFSTIGTLP